MSDKNKKDFDLIVNLFHIEPIDWARKEDGRLVFISPTGQKFIYTDEMIQQIKDDLKIIQAPAPKPAAKPAAALPEKPAPKAAPKPVKK